MLWRAAALFGLCRTARLRVEVVLRTGRRTSLRRDRLEFQVLVRAAGAVRVARDPDAPALRPAVIAPRE